MQLEKLVVEPLEAVVLEQDFLRAFIVIDALDECKEENTTSMILICTVLLRWPLHSLSKFFITSRPGSECRRWLSRDRADTVLQIRWLCIVSHLTSHRRTFATYLQDRLSRIAQFYGLKSWPSSDNLSQLIEQSSGLFIFAATVANFIQDRTASNPRRQLKIMFDQHICWVERGVSPSPS